MNQHPVDLLIRELVDSGRPATRREVSRIIERMATAPFGTQTVVVEPDDRGTSYQGVTLGAHAVSLEYHLIKRVAVERQWADGLTAAQYVEDLRRAVRDPMARLTVYWRRGGCLTATISPTNRVVPPSRRGALCEANLLVVYSADRGSIVTGYQFSDLSRVGIPAVARWLK